MNTKIPILILIILSIAPAISSIFELREFLDPVFRSVNAGHIYAHPSTAVMSAIWIILPVLLLLSALGKRMPHIVAMVLLLYFPSHVVYATYCHPVGLDPTWWNWLVIGTVTLTAETILFLKLKHNDE